MTDLKLQWMADELRDAGLTVVEHSGWKTRSVPKDYPFNPVGLLNHHTAGSAVLVNYPKPPFYSNTSLQDKCNLTIRPDGVVVVLNAGIANDSGMGDPNVLTRLLNDDPPKPPVDWNDDDRVTGNPHFIDIEVQHLGDGSPIVPAQYDALVTTNAVILGHYDWDPMTRLLMHREWTTRKIDPRWNGFTNPGPAIRLNTQETMTMTTEQIKAAIREELGGAIAWTDENGKARASHNAIVDGVWWPQTAGKSILSYLLKAALEAPEVDAEAIAAAISDEMAADVLDLLAKRVAA